MKPFRLIQMKHLLQIQIPTMECPVCEILEMQFKHILFKNIGPIY
jgi:hypothetical protein